MRPTAKYIERVAHSNIFVIATGLAGILSVFLICWERIQSSASYIATLSLVGIAITFYITTLVISVIIRIRYNNFKDIVKHIHRINHDYRNVLHQTFANDSRALSKEDLIKMEKDTLKSVVRRIERIFVSLLNGRDCMVTVKFINTKKDGRRIAKTYVRSEDPCQRDEQGPFEFDVGIGENTAFDTALHGPDNDHKCSFFYGNDLLRMKQLGRYKNQREPFSRDYRSAIVVPIRFWDGHTQAGGQDNQLGFLAVDTDSVNELKEGFHVQLLASFADQMYNFMSLMRKRYLVQGEENHAN